VRSVPECKPIDARQRQFDPLQVIRQHRGIARPFLAEREWGRILHVGAADLHDVVPFDRLDRDRIAQRGDGGNEPLLDIDGGGNVHCRRKGVVRRLRHVDVIVGMNRVLAAERCAYELAATVRNDLVDVHIELGTTPGHPHMQREHVLVAASKDLLTDTCNQGVDLIRQPATSVVCGGGGAFYDRIGNDHFAGDQVAADAEMLQRALGLRTPEFVGWHVNFAQPVGFRSKV
jgi:hypothetical protein